METAKTKSVRDIEQKMEGMDKESLRYHILESAKGFKTSWVELGRALYSVWKDKLYRDWGHSTFDIYTAREIGIRKQTALKLLRSYYFLEKEEPQYLKEEYAESADAATVPSYESIDLLRLAKDKKKVDSHDYAVLKKEIFEKGKDALQVKRDLTALIRQREELDPEEAREKKRMTSLRRYVATLKSLTREIETDKLLPASLIKEAASLMHKIEAEMD